MQHHSSSETLSPPTTGGGRLPNVSPLHSNRKSFEKDIEKGDHNPIDNHEAHQGSEEEEEGRQMKEESNLIGWDGPDDPENPQNWPKSKKYTVTVFFSSLTFCLTFASSIFSTATEVTAKLFGVSNEVMALGTGLFVLVGCGTSL